MIGSMQKNDESGREIAIQVTARGFEPARIRVARNAPVTLVVTRKTEMTCARDLVIDELGVHQALPLDETVRITVTPTKSGPMAFGCAMGKMIRGVVDVV